MTENFRTLTTLRITRSHVWRWFCHTAMNTAGLNLEEKLSKEYETQVENELGPEMEKNEGRKEEPSFKNIQHFQVEEELWVKVETKAEQVFI